MSRAHETKVAAVERRELGLIEPFDDGKDGRIDKTDVRVRVTVDQLAYPRVILGL